MQTTDKIIRLAQDLVVFEVKQEDYVVPGSKENRDIHGRKQLRFCYMEGGYKTTNIKLSWRI